MKYQVMPPGSTDCTSQAPIASGASLAGTCLSSIPAGSQRLVCEATSCTSARFASKDCTGAPTSSITIPTSGSCTSYEVSGAGKAFGIFTQVEGAEAATKGMATPYQGLWTVDACTGGAFQYTDQQARCTGTAIENFKSLKQQCDPETKLVEQCTWTSSMTCDGDHTCFPLQTKAGCASLNASGINSYEYFC